MNESLTETFRYSAWATKALIAVCRDLAFEQLERPARGFGSILATLNHVVRWDAEYVVTLGGVRPAWATEGKESDDLDQIEARVEETAWLWEQLLAKPVDAERLLSLDAGKYECCASVVIAQALHHAGAHREQIRASIGELGVKPPDLQPWEYALQTGRARWRHEEEQWCEKGHIGYVVSGTLEVEFHGQVIQYPEGSGIFIPPGSANGHKARSVTPVVRLVLVEDVQGSNPAP